MAENSEVHPSASQTVHRSEEIAPDTLEEVLWDVAAALIAVDTADQAFGVLADTISSLVPFDSLEIMEVKAASGSLVTVHSAGEDPVHEGEHPEDLHDSLAGQVVLAGEPVWNNDVRALVSIGSDAETSRSRPQALIAVPLDAGHGAIGTLHVTRFGSHRRFDQRDFETLCQFGRLSALVLSKARRTRTLQLAAETDQLTGLANRRCFIDALAAAMDTAREEAGDLSLLMFDVDNFKSVNDTYGHGVGDEILCRIADVAREACRNGDLVCRTGGEEFSILLPGATRAAAHRVGERLMQLLASEPIAPVGRVSVSAGVAQWKQHQDADEFIGTADGYLYSAKGAGKAQVAS